MVKGVLSPCEGSLIRLDEDPTRAAEDLHVQSDFEAGLETFQVQAGTSRITRFPIFWTRACVIQTKTHMIYRIYMTIFSSICTMDTYKNHPLFLDLDDWKHLLHELDIKNEYGTYLDPHDVVTGNMDAFARDMRRERVDR